MKQFTFLLDVDGVINGTKPGWSSAPHKGYAYFNGREYTMRWAPQLISRLWTLHRNPAVSIVWATSWCGQTEQLERLFKLPQLLSAGSTRMQGSDKYKAALEVVESGRHLIWADDEFVPEFGPWYDELTKYNSALLLKPTLRRGLRPEHMDRADQFVLG